MMDRNDLLWGSLVRRILSGGRPGVERAALDAAIANSIPHGGSCPKGSRHGSALADRYQLTEVRTRDLGAAESRNMRDADAVAVITRGSETRVVDCIEMLAAKKGKLFLHIDLDELGERTGIASGKVKDLMLRPVPGKSQAAASVLFVTGSTEDESPGIEAEVRQLLERSLRDPETIDEAAEKLLWELPDEPLARLRSLSDDELIDTHFGIAMYVRNAYGLFRPNCPLTQRYPGHPDEVSGDIVRRAWELARQAPQIA